MSQEEAADAITEDILHKKSDYIKDFLKATEKSETESDVKKGKDMFIQMEKLERLSIFEREPETIPEIFMSQNVQSFRHWANIMTV